MADDKKTQLGTSGPTAFMPTGGAANVSPVAVTDPGSKTSYLPPPPDDPLLGQTLAGRYQVERKLGEGGMGAVYLATHNLLDKQVALKVLHSEFARKADLVERFMQEAKAASRIRHENVIDISDFGKTPEGLVFFAMELLRGHDLHEEIARARLAGHLLPWERSKKMFLQICSALAAAHAQGIIHRDLKPENIYLVDFLGEPDFVKLLDFGIAKVTELAEGERKLTRTGMLFGTPEYMSPEQARGENVDVRVDVYAMGCILFQLTTGRVPFEADNFMGVLSMHLTEPPPVVPYEVLDVIGAPREISAIIDRALAKDRNERFQTIEDFANAVRAACGEEPVVRGTRQQAAVRPVSVPMPAQTVTARPTPTPAIAAAKSTTRPKTQWTGKLEVPEYDEGPPPKQGSSSKLPLIIGAAVLVIGGGITAAVLATRGDGNSNAAIEPGTASGSAPIVTTTPDAAVIVTHDPPPTPPPPEVTLPKTVKVHLESKPAGAEIKDAATGKVIGKAPYDGTLDGTHARMTYLFHIRGYVDNSFEFAPDKDVAYTAELKRGTGAPVKVTQTGQPVTTPGGGSGSATGAITHPDPGHPPGPAINPATGCPDDGLPCLKKKEDIPGLKEPPADKDKSATPPPTPPAAPAPPAGSEE